jgi:hypothetical protein
MADLRRITAMRLGLVLFTRHREVASHARTNTAPGDHAVRPGTTAFNDATALDCVAP